MSCFIVSDKTINQIVTLLPAFQPYTRKYIRRSYNTNEECQALAQAMLNLNYKAFRYRYGKTKRDHPDRAIKFELTDCSKAQALKSLQCWLYQCTEGSAMKVPLYGQMESLRDDIQREQSKFGITEEDYQNAEWGA